VREPEKLIPLPRAADETGIPYRTMLELVVVGALEAVDLRARGTIRPRWWVRRSAVAAMLEARTQNKRTERTERVTVTPVRTTVRPP
jgi:hypothetical protein